MFAMPTLGKESPQEGDDPVHTNNDHFMKWVVRSYMQNF